MFPYVSIIIPTKNGGDKFKVVLKAIYKNKTDFGFEIIAVDSGSQDNTKEIISNFPVRLIEIAPFFFNHGRARNLGAQNATGEILVFLTQDAVPKDESWMSNLVKYFQNKNVAGVYGRQLPSEDASPLEKFFLQYLYPDHQIIKRSIDPANCILKDIFFSNVNSAIRKSVWEEIKFNEKLIMSEDQEWSKRALLKGREIIYAPEAAVYHSHNYSFSTIIQRNFDSGMSLKGLVNAPFRKSFAYEFDYLKTGFIFFLKKRMYKFLLIFPFYESARILGFFLGFHSRLLPLFIKKCLSQNKIHWVSQIKNTSD